MIEECTRNAQARKQRGAVIVMKLLLAGRASAASKEDTMPSIECAVILRRSSGE